VLRPKPKARDQSSGLKVAPVVQSDVVEIKIGGKPAIITAWTPLLNGPTTLQLVVLIDSQERIGVGNQFDDIRNLFASLPSNVEIAVGYMLHGKTEIAQPFTTDRVLAGNALRPMTEEAEAVSSKNDDGSPYRCLHDLSVNWPNPDPKKVRAVLMFTSGIPHDINGFGDLKDPPLLDLEVEMASEDLIGAGIAPFSVFYIDPVPRKGRPRQSGPGSLGQLVQATNGQNLWDPPNVSFSPELYRFFSILYSEAVVTVAAKGSGLKGLDIQSTSDDLNVVGPQEVMIGNELPKK